VSSTVAAVKRTCSASRPTGAAQTGTGQQQRREISQSREIAGAGASHAHELGGSPPGLAARRGGTAGGDDDDGPDRGISGGRGKTRLAVAVGDRRGAAAERAGIQPFARGGAPRGKAC
jgi:hypothetical protein